MRLINDKLDYAGNFGNNDVLMFTANSVVKNNGALVMGAGAALAVRKLFPGIDRYFGRQIESMSEFRTVFVYFQHKNIGAFQTKRYHGDNSSLVLLRNSVSELKNMALQNSHRIFHLNYPAIGYGALPISLVQPLVEGLPDNVYLYKI